jgi:uncharacterized membrane protein YebE (DUF533 family)
MFDAKKLLDAMVAGTSPAGAPGQGGLGDLLNQVTQRMGQGGGQSGAPGGQGGGGGFGDLLNQVTGQGGGASGGQSGAGSLGDIFGQLQQRMAPGGGAGGGAGGDLGSILGGVFDKVKQATGAAGSSDLGQRAKDVFGQATSGVRDAARDVNDKTGVGGGIEDIIKQMSGGQGAGDLLARAKELMANNPAAAGALAGALGTLVLGTRSGRGVAMDAAKLGGLVLVGGLAYKAWNNYKAGQTTTASSHGVPAPAPAGSGFDGAQSNDHAVLYLRAMIAAAASDGQVTNAERQRIFGSLGQLGLDPGAHDFLEREFSLPASVAELAASASSPEVAAQVYSAARVAIEPQAPAERKFLTDLAAALRLDPNLVAHIDAAATSLKA